MMQRLPDSQEAAAQELLRATKLCNPHFDTIGRITLSVDASSDPSWMSWRDEVFVPFLQPALGRVRLAWDTGDLDAVQSVDSDLSLQLNPASSASSQEAGRHLALDFTPPAGAKLFSRYRSRIEQGKSSGHLACVFAARTSLFHIAPRTAVAAYLLQEALSVTLPEGSQGLLAMISDCLAAGPQDSAGLIAA